MPGAEALRRELSVRGQEIAVATGSLHELTTAETPSVIFGRTENHQHGNFYPASYRNICANPEWVRRLAKVHTGSRRASQIQHHLDCILKRACLGIVWKRPRAGNEILNADQLGRESCTINPLRSNLRRT